jgi:1,4-alpha-glucan branching enzyme
MSIKKQYLKNEPACKVTFKISKEQVQGAESVRILGDFNSWNHDAEPVKKLKNGGFSQTLKLNPGKEYHFRYLINDSVWDNEPEADKHVPNGMGTGNNSVIVL